MQKVYLISSDIDGKKLYKIGYTKRKVEDRIREFKTGNASKFDIIDVYQSKWGRKLEICLHKHFESNRINGEWFNLKDSQIEDFRRICEITNSNFELLENYNTYIIEKGGLLKIK